jgi:hypothetical protein
MAHGARGMEYEVFDHLQNRSNSEIPCSLPHAPRFYIQLGSIYKIPINFTESSLNGDILHKVPNAAGTGAGTEAASDAKVFVHHIFISIVLQFFSADR